MDNPNYLCNTSRGQPNQHHTATEHAGTHGEMGRQVEQGQGGTSHSAAANAILQAICTLYHAT